MASSGMVHVPLVVVFFLLFGIYPGYWCEGNASTRQKEWQRDPSFDDSTILTNSTTIGGDNYLFVAKSGAACGANCLQKSWCKSFFYQRPSRLCHLHSSKFMYPAADMVSETGSKYYKTFDCPSDKGYSLSSYSGLCYKVNATSTVGWETARAQCVADGGDLVTLDTDKKVQTLVNVLITVPEYVNNYYHVGAARPLAEWNTLWTSSSSPFTWLRTGQPMNTPYFITNEPSKDTAGVSCMSMTAFGAWYTNFTHFQTFADGYCTYQSYAVCEIPQ